MRPVAQCIGTALACAILYTTPPSVANAAASRYLATDVQQAIERLEGATDAYSSAARNVYRSQSPASVEAYASTLVDVALSTEPSELAKLADISLDVVLSIPAEATATAVASVKGAFAGVSPDTCDLAPLPSAAVVSRATASDAFALVDSAKLKAAKALWAPAWTSVPKSVAGQICLPPQATLESVSRAQLKAARAIDRTKLAAASAQAQATVDSLPKGRTFRIFASLKQSERDALAMVRVREREAFKKASAELLEANAFVDELLARQAAGPPKCFTIGCQANYDYDLWRYSSKDDYIGEGLERRQDAILSPKPISKEDLERRAAEFAAGR